MSTTRHTELDQPADSMGSAKDPGVGKVFGIVAGGSLGLVCGLAQYNALFTGHETQHLIATGMTLLGGVIGCGLGAALGMLADALLKGWRGNGRASAGAGSTAHSLEGGGKGTASPSQRRAA